MTTLKYHIIIIGAGPTGLVLANLLGQFNLKILIVESETEVFPIPRATHIDEETLRNFQLTGLFNLLKEHITPFGSMQVKDAGRKVIFEEEIIQPNSEHYYKGSCFFDQPAFEKILREGLNRYPNVTLLVGVEAQEIKQIENYVTVKIKDKSTNEFVEYTAPWLVGCDGGRSIVRSSLKIEMHALEPARDWIIVDTLLKHPDDAKLLPDKFQYNFDKERLTIFAHGIGNNNRWEFQLNKNEIMPDNKTIISWVGKYIDIDKLQITRIAKYAHNSLVAQQWKINRVILAGDAAHMMPPSAGQGLCSGVRDAVNLAWKLDRVINNQASEKLLSTYEQERKHHLYQILKRTLFFGKTLNADNYFERLLRSVKIRLIQNIQPLKMYLRNKYNAPPKLENGILSSQSSLAGQHLPQIIIDIDNKLSDDIVGYKFVCIALSNTLTSLQVNKLKQKSILLFQDIIEVKQTPFQDWLKSNHIDFVIARPDKIIFGAGKSEQFDSILQELEIFQN